MPHMKVPLLRFSALLIAVLPMYCTAAKPYTPKTADPILEPWRWRHEEALDGLGVMCMAEADDGSLWVLTSHGSRARPEGALGVFDVFDKDGRFVRQVTLYGQGDPSEDAFFFDGDRLYVVTGFLDAAMALQGGGATEEEESEEEPTPMEVICYRVDTPVVAKGE